MSRETLMSLQACHLKIVKGFKILLEDIHFSLTQGQSLLFRGHNGAGKSTLLRVLAGLSRPFDGKLLFNGAHDAYQDRQDYLHNVAYLGHQNALKATLTVAENICTLGVARAALREALKAFNMEEMIDRPTRHFSAGQLRRVALARVMASRRPLWLLDEPFVGLDTHSRARLCAALTQHQQAGGMVILSSHDPVALDGMKVMTLARGRMMPPYEAEQEGS